MSEPKTYLVIDTTQLTAQDATAEPIRFEAIEREESSTAALDRAAVIASEELGKQRAEYEAELSRVSTQLAAAEARLKEVEETARVLSAQLEKSRESARNAEQRELVALAELDERTAQLGDANARADIWERNYAACGDKDLTAIIAQKDKTWADYNAAIEQAATLRAALEQYADMSNWLVNRDERTPTWIWLGDDGNAIAQAALEPAGEVKQDESLADRLDAIAIELNHYAFGKDKETGDPYPEWEEIGMAFGALERAVNRLRTTAA